MFCKNCGKEVSENAFVCPSCGVRVNAVAENGLGVSKKNGKSKVCAGLLGIFLGGLGIHNFYMGKTGLGIVDILFCWTGIPEIVGFVKGVIYLCESQEKFDSRF